MFQWAKQNIAGIIFFMWLIKKFQKMPKLISRSVTVDECRRVLQSSERKQLILITSCQKKNQNFLHWF